MNHIALFLQSCANNNRLNVFLALAFLGPLPVSVNEIADFTDINRHTVSECLDKLRAIGMALCKGALKRTDWQLSPAGWVMAHALFSVIGANTPPQLGQPQALPMAENLPSANPSYGRKSAIGEEAMAENLPSASGMAENLPSAVVESESVNHINSISTELEAAKILRGQYATILAAGGVYKNVIPGLLPGLELQPDYVPHLLAHLAYVKSGRAKTEQGYIFGGVYLKECAEILVRVPENELPPAEVDFETAFRWAMNGGLTDEQKTEREAKAAQAEREHEERMARLEAAQAEQAEAEAERAATPLTELEKMWQTVLEQLQMEITRTTFDTWVRETTLVTHEDGTFVVGAPNSYAKDWLENRLATSIRRVLAGLPEHKSSHIQVRFVVSNQRKE